MTGGLYRMVSPSGREYIGITLVGFEQRYREHLSHKKINTPIGKAFQKYGNAMVMTALVICDNQDALCLMEQNAIRIFDTLVPNGYNLSPGGEAGHCLYKEMKCAYCDNIFQGRIGISKFCSIRCQKSFRYFSGIENENRVCEKCGNIFNINRHKHTTHCSRSCAQKGHQNGGVSVFIDDIIYPSLRAAGRALGTNHHTIKRRFMKDK